MSTTTPRPSWKTVARLFVSSINPFQPKRMDLLKTCFLWGSIPYLGFHILWTQHERKEVEENARIQLRKLEKQLVRAKEGGRRREDLENETRVSINENQEGNVIY
ncbi:hypothetical protein HMI54_001010 [Coelomomyces lativittatus]|nr:hypothetical protein HMI56_005628 [Coelomomyces lativittatus]KAJ1505242.1 hypothetical protein HMI55_001680 [Coelomomyces lativittatus]KAJ1511150.1 hypothetical protein HMI54_001010 [Coelomomyces lativittatus]